MRFGGQVNDRLWAGFPKDPRQRGPVADVDLLEAMTRIAAKMFDRPTVAGVCQLVDVDDLVYTRAQYMSDERGADEAGSAGDQNSGIGFKFRQFDNYSWARYRE